MVLIYNGGSHGDSMAMASHITTTATTSAKPPPSASASSSLLRLDTARLLDMDNHHSHYSPYSARSSVDYSDVPLRIPTRDHKSSSFSAESSAYSPTCPSLSSSFSSQYPASSCSQELQHGSNGDAASVASTQPSSPRTPLIVKREWDEPAEQPCFLPASTSSSSSFFHRKASLKRALPDADSYHHYSHHHHHHADDAAQKQPSLPPVHELLSASRNKRPRYLPPISSYPAYSGSASPEPRNATPAPARDPITDSLNVLRKESDERLARDGRTGQIRASLGQPEGLDVNPVKKSSSSSPPPSTALAHIAPSSSHPHPYQQQQPPAYFSEHPHPQSPYYHLRLHSSSASAPAPPPPSADEDARRPPRSKAPPGTHCNVKYTTEESDFVRYHNVDEGLPWEEVTRKFEEKWGSGGSGGSGLTRQVQGLQGGYYRENKKLPHIEADNRLVFLENGHVATVDVKVRRQAQKKEQYGLLYLFPERAKDYAWVSREGREYAARLSAPREIQRKEAREAAMARGTWVETPDEHGCACCLASEDESFKRRKRIKACGDSVELALGSDMNNSDSGIIGYRGTAGRYAPAPAPAYYHLQ